MKAVLKQTLLLLCCILLSTQTVLAERIKDLASIQGVRSNQLIGR